MLRRPSAGSALPVTFHVVNDKADGTAIPPSTLHWAWVWADDAVDDDVAEARKFDGQHALPQVAHYATSTVQINLTIPLPPLRGDKDETSGATVKLMAKVVDSSGATIASNVEAFGIFTPPLSPPPSLLAASAGASVGLFDPHGSTAAAFERLGLHTAKVSASALSTLSAATTPALVIGEDTWRGKSMEAAVTAYVASGGRVAILQQSMAPQAFTPTFLDQGLVAFDMQDKVGHSGRNVSNGEPVHVQRPSHPLFTTPNAIADAKRFWRRWSLRTPWVETSKDNGPLPDNSPAASGVRWEISDADISSKDTPSAANVSLQWARNAATSRRSSVLMSHSRGMTNQVLLEIFSPPTNGTAVGSALLVGLGLTQRSVAEPVADLFMQNMLHYLADRGNIEPPHPHFEPGHTITWGDYASERGVAFSNPSGLSIWACAYNATCGLNGQGNKPCGRTLLGPFSWGHMGVNTDLNPKNLTAWGAVWVRTNATKLTTTFALLPGVATADGLSATVAIAMGQAPLPSVSMLIEVLGDDNSVHALVPCTTSHRNRGGKLAEVDCTCEVGHPGVEKHLGLRFSGTKLHKGSNHLESGVGLLQTVFS